VYDKFIRTLLDPSIHDRVRCPSVKAVNANVALTRNFCVGSRRN